jgi:hypothetical protein
MSSLPTADPRSSLHRIGAADRDASAVRCSLAAEQVAAAGGAGAVSPAQMLWPTGFARAPLPVAHFQVLAYGWGEMLRITPSAS